VLSHRVIAKLLSFLSGKKTYIVAAGAILTALGAYLNSSISLTELIQAAFAALGASTLRAAISKGEKPYVN
jgi:hypothetical protein